MTTGRLVIWQDCAIGAEEMLEAWYKSEHLPERLGVPGFRRARRWLTVRGAPAFLTLYEVDSPEVLTSAAYLARLNDPTPLSRRIMREAIRNMSRTVCRLAAGHGRLRGGWGAALRLPALPREFDALLAEIARRPSVARAEAWTDAVDAPETEESRLRGGDGRVAACLWVETLREADAHGILRELSERCSGDALVHRLLCEAHRARPRQVIQAARHRLHGGNVAD